MPEHPLSQADCVRLARPCRSDSTTAIVCRSRWRMARKSIGKTIDQVDHEPTIASLARTGPVVFVTSTVTSPTLQATIDSFLEVDATTVGMSPWMPSVPQRFLTHISRPTARASCRITASIKPRSSSRSELTFLAPGFRPWNSRPHGARDECLRPTSPRNVVSRAAGRTHVADGQQCGSPISTGAQRVRVRARSLGR